MRDANPYSNDILTARQVLTDGQRIDQLTDDQLAAAGQRIANVLGLKAKNDRYQLNEGFHTKSALGLASVLIRILSEAKN